MTNRAIIVIRFFVVTAFLVGMPILALPQIADWVTERLYGSSNHASQPVAAQVTASRPVQVQAPVPVDPPLGTEPNSQSLESPPSAPFPEFPARSGAQVPDREQLASYEAELQSLGAIFYRLEYLESDPAAFRLTAQFERRGPLPERFQTSTTAADPAAAMQAMIEQVRTRRSVARP